MDAAIRSTFGPGGRITPDQVRGESATLPAAIRARGRPTLESSRGRARFALDDEGKTRLWAIPVNDPAVTRDVEATPGSPR